MASSGQPAASAQLAAASALRTLCQPVTCRPSVTLPAGVCSISAQWSPFHSAWQHTSARPCNAKVNVGRAPAKPCHSGAWSSSAGNTATPVGPSASITAPFSRATASMLCMNSWCSRCALLTSATLGAAIAASAAISPGWFMPSSSTAARCQQTSSWRSRSSVSGTPMSLLKLPAVASAASPSQACRMAATICVTVVLPLLPVTAISGSSICCRHAAASSPSARRLSVTCRPGRPDACRPRSASAAKAPIARACGKKSCASKRSPRSATNKSPARRLRVSLCTRSTRTEPSPTNAEPGSRACARARVITLEYLASAAPSAPRRHRKTAASRRGCPGNPRGPCRRSG